MRSTTPQHLSDPTAYRSDRRKDAGLQENSIFVLRFLAEDLGKHLDATLDAILRTVGHLQMTKVASTTEQLNAKACLTTHLLRAPSNLSFKGIPANWSNCMP